MSAPYSTFALNEQNDFYLDASGNMVVLTPNGADPTAPLAQDIASAVTTFLGEVYYDKSVGVAYGEILGSTPPLSVLQTQVEDQALTVPYVATAELVILGFSNRQAQSQLQFTDEAGNPGVAQL